MVPHPPATTPDPSLEDLELLAKIASVLAEIYEPAGVLIYWSARITYLDNKRPCDLWRDGDMEALDHLWRRLEGIADGVFL